MDDGETDGYRLNVRFPNSALLLLRATNKMPDEMVISIETPGGCSTYPVKVIKESNYSIKDMLEKRLYLLIPFYLFNREKELDIIDSQEQRVEELLELYSDSLKKLDEAVERGDLSTFSRGVIIDLTNRVTQKLTMNYDNVRRKVGEFMGGKVMDLDIIRERREGRQEGRQEGQNILVTAIQRLRRGESADDLRADGIDENTIALAISCR